MSEEIDGEQMVSPGNATHSGFIFLFASIRFEGKMVAKDKTGCYANYLSFIAHNGESANLGLRSVNRNFFIMSKCILKKSINRYKYR